jgi:phosphopentomutase
VSAARRAVVLVIDACGVGALPDAGEYGDAGTNTLAHVAEAVGGLDLPALAGLGLGAIVQLAGSSAVVRPYGIHGRLHPLGPGKDSISGHWELMGVVMERALPTYPSGFPPELVRRLTEAMGHEVICNRPDNGLAAIERYGAEHLATGALILYTSQDSVLQLAGHVDRVAPAELYAACERTRAVMSGEHGVGRVIARPFTGAPGAFARTDGRRDYALAPSGRSYLEELADAGVPVHGVGKITDLFAGVGITCSHPGSDNARALASVTSVLAQLSHGLVFANLIDTDQVYGHRKDAEGFAGALRAVDVSVGGLLASLQERDLLVVTADHGVDPAHAGTDHTREYAPLLAVTGAMAAAGPAAMRDASAVGDGFAPGGDAATPRRHDGPLADVGATVLRWLTGGSAKQLPGRAFIS